MITSIQVNSQKRNESVSIPHRRSKQNLGCFLDEKLFETKQVIPEHDISYAKKLSANTPVNYSSDPIQSEDINHLNSASNGSKKGNRKIKKTPQTTTTLGSAFPSSLVEEKAAVTFTTLSVQKEKKEDYWYYDKESDGFYYEFAGSRGWKKRNKNTPLKDLNATPQPMKYKNNVPVEIPRPSEHNYVQQHYGNKDYNNMNNMTKQDYVINNKAHLPSTSSSGSLNSNNQIYDPQSDGYYYNLSGVEGWKKRTEMVSCSKNSCSSPNFINAQPHRSQMHSTESAVSGESVFINNEVDFWDRQIKDEFGSSVQSAASTASSSLSDEIMNNRYFLENPNCITKQTFASYMTDDVPVKKSNSLLLKNDFFKNPEPVQPKMMSAIGSQRPSSKSPSHQDENQVANLNVYPNNSNIFDSNPYYNQYSSRKDMEDVSKYSLGMREISNVFNEALQDPDQNIYSRPSIMEPSKTNVWGYEHYDQEPYGFETLDLSRTKALEQIWNMPVSGIAYSE
uniref:WW domain-containing protein n=1 Tax=Rhabditophanes sp. KR3021 TaxID=114890 RepID=A0AC35UH02_9BILA